MIINLDWSSWNLIQALARTASVARKLRVDSNFTYLANNTQRFSKFLNSTEVPVITIAVLADGNIELDLGKIKTNKYKFRSQNAHLVILIIGGNLSQVPLDAAATQHDAREAIIEGLLRRYLPYADRSLFPDSIASYDLFDLIDAGTELRSPLENIVEQTVGEVKRHSTRTDVSGV